jgi:hypothetical protein
VRLLRLIQRDESVICLSISADCKIRQEDGKRKIFSLLTMTRSTVQFILLPPPPVKAIWILYTTIHSLCKNNWNKTFLSRRVCVRRRWNYVSSIIAYLDWGLERNQDIKKNSMVWVHERTIPIERPPLVGEVIANFLRIEGATWSAWRIPTAVFSVF